MLGRGPAGPEPDGHGWLGGRCQWRGAPPGRSQLLQRVCPPAETSALESQPLHWVMQRHAVHAGPLSIAGLL